MLFVTIFVLFFILRIAPYIHNNIPLGYDPGMYLYMFTKYAHVPWWQFFSLPAWIVGNEPGIFVIQRLLTLGNPALAEASLIPLIIGASLLCFLGVWLVAKKLWGQGAALWTVFLFTVSALQYRTYWYYYLKNVTALSFVSLAVYSLLHTSYWAVPFVILTFYFHRPTAVFLLVILLVGWWTHRKERRYYARVLLISLAVAAPYYAATFTSTILPLVAPIAKGFNNPGSGTFYDILPALGLSLIYLPFGLWGLVKQRRDKNTLLLAVPLVLAILAVACKIFFWRRLIIFADFFLLFFAGWAANEFFRAKTKIRLIVKVVYVITCVIFIVVFIRNTAQPMVYPDELAEIRLLGKTEPNAYVLVTDRDYMPFVYGWSQRRVIAPGFGEFDTFWTIPQWHQFWESNNRQTEKNLLLKLPKPLYIFKGERTTLIYTDVSGTCFQRINWRTFKFVCTN
jgi:hypothetical protein